jgi:hypothetical protein
MLIRVVSLGFAMLASGRDVTVADTIFGHPINPNQVPIIRPTIERVGWW